MVFPTGSDDLFKAILVFLKQKLTLYATILKGITATYAFKIAKEVKFLKAKYISEP